MDRLISCLALALLLPGCASGPVETAGGTIEVSRVRIAAMGQGAGGGADTLSRCSGFLLSEGEVRSYLTHASRFPDSEPERHYRILPCFAAGTAVIDGRKYAWVIRAGGVGELSSGADRFVTICGKGCCDKVPGIC